MRWAVTEAIRDMYLKCAEEHDILGELQELAQTTRKRYVQAKIDFRKTGKWDKEVKTPTEPATFSSKVVELSAHGMGRVCTRMRQHARNKEARQPDPQGIERFFGDRVPTRPSFMSATAVSHICTLEVGDVPNVNVPRCLVRMCASG